MLGSSNCLVVYRMSSMVSVERRPWSVPSDLVHDPIPKASLNLVIGHLGALATLSLALGRGPARAQAPWAQDPTPGGCELVLPPVCSRTPTASTAPATICEVMVQPGPDGQKRV